MLRDWTEKGEREKKSFFFFFFPIYDDDMMCSMNKNTSTMAPEWGIRRGTWEVGR